MAAAMLAGGGGGLLVVAAAAALAVTAAAAAAEGTPTACAAASWALELVAAVAMTGSRACNSCRILAETLHCWATATMVGWLSRLHLLVCCGKQSFILR